MEKIETYFIDNGTDRRIFVSREVKKRVYFEYWSRCARPAHLNFKGN